MARMAGGAEPTIGIVGPHELVERIMLSGLPLTPGPGRRADADRETVARETAARRLVTAAYRDEQEAPGEGGPAGQHRRRVPVRQPGALRARPAGRGAHGPGHLHPAQRQPPVRGAAAGQPGRAATSPGPASTCSARPTPRTRSPSWASTPTACTSARRSPARPSIASFHERLWQLEQTTVAFTCLQSVARRLAAAQIPVFPLRPTGSADPGRRCGPPPCWPASGGWRTRSSPW